MIRRYVSIILVLLISYCIFLIWNAPAAWLAARIRPDLARMHVALTGVTGTAWQGQAELSLRGTDLGRLHWQTRPWGLVHGTVSAQIRLQGADIEARGQVEAARSGTSLSDVSGKAGLALMATLTGLPTALVGSLTARLDQLRFDSNGRPEAVQGRIVAHDARLPQLGVAVGTLTLALQSSDGSIIGRLSNSGGDLDLDGTLALTPAGAYTLHATLKPHAGKNRLTDGLAAFLGSPDAEARYHYDTSGHLAR